MKLNACLLATLLSVLLRTGTLHADVINLNVVPIAFLDLGTLPDFNASHAVAVNDRGEVVGVSYTDDFDYHGFFWSQAVGMVPLGSWGGGYSAAVAISCRGEVGREASTAD